MVSCSHMFALINLDDNKNLIRIPNLANKSTNGVTRITTTENNAPVNNTSEKNAPGNNTDGNIVVESGIPSAIATKKTIVETCGLRFDKNNF